MGRAILLNSILNDILVFFLSFLKMPMKVWKTLVKIQRRFLLGGVKDDSKTSLVKCTKCKPKKKWGLGVRDLRMFNLALQTK